MIGARLGKFGSANLEEKIVVKVNGEDHEDE